MQEVLPEFHPANNVCNAGVLFMLPALLSQGLFKTSKLLDPLRKGYYGLTSTLLVLSFMLLSRIKCPEQLKTCKVGELGRVIGLDRVPEVRCLRNKLAQIVDQGKTETICKELMHEWIVEDDAAEAERFYYVDGHVRVYHGSKAKLPKRFVSREKLCLPGTTEFWVNNELGMPYMVVSGELNEKLKEVMLSEIIPRLLKETAAGFSDDALQHNPQQSRFVMVFDREAYDLSFFKELWETHRIAVLTYRKAVKDVWPESDFKNMTASVIGKDVSMLLAEKQWEHSSITMREIRKLSENGHQTSIITTMQTSSCATLAGKMFSRWSQENFFRYMKQDYDLDRLVEYGVEEVNMDAEVVNPEHRQLAYKLKKTREKLTRIKARLYAKIEQKMIDNIDSVKQDFAQQAEQQDDVDAFTREIVSLKQKLDETPRKIKIKDMPKSDRYNKLKPESKLFMNLLRIIAYRAESVVVNILAPHYTRAEDECRMLVKEIIKCDADMIPDYDKKTLTIKLHTMSTPRANAAVQKLCDLLNKTETIFPESNLTLIYDSVRF